ncbi:MAG: hypothetical protein R3C14_33285 [Caldilineaceae bacterium]
MRILFSTVLWLGLFIASFAYVVLPTARQTALAGTIPNQPPASTVWQIDPTQMNIGIFVLDYATLTLHDAYFLQEPACTQRIANEVLAANAHTALTGTATGTLIQTVTEAGGTLYETADAAGDFYAWHINLGDYTAQALLHPCTGHPIFVGETIWAGHGLRPYPTHSLTSTLLVQLSTAITTPQAVTLLEQSAAMTVSAESAWGAIANLNLVHDLAHDPAFKTIAFLYKPATGYVDPALELAEAEWVFIIYCLPTPTPAHPANLYLPLVQQ